MEDPIFTMVCVVDRESALRRLEAGGIVTLSHPNPDVGAEATIRGVCVGQGAPRSHYYEVTLYPEGLTLNDEIGHLGLNGVLQLALDHVFAD